MFALNSTILTPSGGVDNQFFAGTVATGAILATAAIYYVLGSKDKEHDFPRLRGIQFYHAWNFFQQRYDFLQSNFQRNLGKSFSFKVVHHNVVALTGEDARQVFFSDPHLNFDQGYKILMGTAPQLSDVDIATEENEDGNVTIFNKRLNKLLSRTRMQSILPTLLQDILAKADKWGDTGRINPFDGFRDLVFLMTARMTTCHDLTMNEADVEKINELLVIIQAGASPTSMLLPWFPTPSKKMRKWASTELYTTLRDYVEARRQQELTSDAIDVLIAGGETTQNIVGFVMGVLFAGVINTGVISSWMLVHLAIHPEWMEKCKKEIQDLLSRHLCDSLSSATLSEKLSAIPVSAWEDELPILEACTRESQRLTLSGTTLRRNLRKDFKIGEQVVKRGDFLAYTVADVHLNPGYYPDPYKYDPGRWLRPDPVPDSMYTFLGWGAGRHPCTGMKVAKLEMKLVSAVFLARYEFELVDEGGKFPDPLPVPDRNDTHRSRPLGGSYYFNFKKVVQ